jgi:hypothetical protein
LDAVDWRDRFEVERKAGAGAMGTVYRARDRDSGAVVAVKLVERLAEYGIPRPRKGTP